MNDLDGYILVADDEASIREYFERLFSKLDLPVITCGNGKEAVQQLQDNNIILVVTDIRMPEMNGLELMDAIHGSFPEIPVILMTGHADLDVAIEAVNRGAFSFLSKPFKKDHVVNVVERGINQHRLICSEKNYLTTLENSVLRKTRELEDSAMMANKLSVELVQRLAGVAEFRDTYTAAHISRIGLYSRVLAEAMNMYPEFTDAIAVASSLHDIGKIGIPDSILLKKGSLTEGEREIMNRHTLIGNKILDKSFHPTIQMASTIALNHHEQWDGGGYPNGFRGVQIPVEARIVKLADEYDALRSIRSYKNSFDHEETCRILIEGDGRTLPEHFDPEVLETFKLISARFEGIFSSNQD